MKPVIKETKCQNYDNGGYHRLNDSKHDRNVKERSTSGPISDGLGACDERRDRIVETENADLADDICRGPRNREYAERRRAQQPGDKKCKDAAKIRCQHRDRVQERAAFQLHSSLVDPRWRVYYRWLEFTRGFERVYSPFTSPIADWGNFDIMRHERTTMIRRSPECRR
jgi:hypothetical protein